MKILFDSNIIIDALTKRPSSKNECSELLKIAAFGCFEAYIVDKQITDIYYVIRKYIPNEDKRRQLIEVMLEIFNVIPLNKQIFLKSLKSERVDFVDNVLIEAAITNKLDCILTTDLEHFKNNNIEIIDPEKLLNLISKE